MLSKLAGGALVIVGTDRIHRAQLLDTLESLSTAGAHIFGVVINKVSRRDAGGYGYDAAYGYRSQDEDAAERDDLTARTQHLQPVPRRQLQQGRI